MEAPIRPGALLLGKYRVESVLGKGGMGLVVAARHLDLDELRAIKLLLPETLRDPHAEDRFLREARITVRLKSEHAARVYDTGRLPTGELFIVSELLSGADLKHIVQERGPLSVEEAATYALQASLALAEAHALGIIHRDIKPANLFLARRPDGAPCVKVLDFGISKQVASDSVELTTTGTLLGSPLYMSPEQMVRTRAVDPRSDIWAMGVVLYELVTGTLPFRADTAPEVFYLVLHEEAAPPSRLRPGLPAEMDAIIARCLQKIPDHRYQRVEELSSALAALLDRVGRGLVSRPHVASQPTLAPAASPALAAAPAGPPETMPASPPPAVVSTGSAWGHTGAHGRPTTGHRGRAIARAATGVSALAACISWFALQTEPEGVQAPIAASSSLPGASPADDRRLPSEVAPSPAEALATPPSPLPPPATAGTASSARSSAPRTPRGTQDGARASLPRLKLASPARTASPPSVPASPTSAAPEAVGAPPRQKHEPVY
ncbi:protein kinase domain-containing protein [Sorangium sp. So ce1182]|uniref:serine/threonine-protein kinase n=1 Tax=Sorangium sp. So ce1182 TaxID=3133334 RepID=UPI003F61B3BF